MTRVPGAPPRSPDALGREASTAIGWGVLNVVLARLGTLTTGIVLARLLGPTEMGRFAIALVALLAVLAVNDLGVSLAIVRWPGDPRAIAPTVTTLAFASSTALFIIAWLAAPGLCRLMGDPSAVWVVRVICIGVLLDGAVATPAAAMQRLLMQRRRTLIDQVNVWLGSAVSVALTIAGAGAMSLAIGRVVGGVVAGAMFVRATPIPYRWGWDPSHVRSLVRYGGPLAGASVIVFAVSFIDQVLVGHRLGPAQLGLYVLALNLASWPTGVLAAPVRNVAPALFARLQDDPRAMRESLRTMLSLVAVATLPVSLVLAGAAVPVVAIVYGSSWAGAAAVLPWLAAAAVVRAVGEVAYDYLSVSRASHRLLATQAIWAAALIPAVWLSAGRWGVVGAAAAQAVVALAVGLPLYALALRAVGATLRPDPRAYPGLAVAVAGGLLAYWLSTHIGSELPAMAACVVSGLVVAALVAVTARSLARSFLAIREA